MVLEHVGHRSKLSKHSLKSVTRLLLWTVLPFLTGLLLVFAIYHTTQGVSRHRRLGELNSQLDLQGSAGKVEPCGSRALAESADLASTAELSRLKGALTKQSLTKVLGAAQSDHPQTQTVRVNEDALPSVFLFVGVLSGRGYR